MFSPRSHTFTLANVHILWCMVLKGHGWLLRPVEGGQGWQRREGLDGRRYPKSVEEPQ